jgi:purine-binding chemotaxis protein CheW
MTHAETLNAYLDGLLTEAPSVAPAPAPAPVPVPVPVQPPAIERVAPLRAAVLESARPPVAPAPPAPTRAPAEPATALPAGMPTLPPGLARLFAPPPSSNQRDGESSIRWLCFLLANQMYAVEVQKVQEVVRVPDIAPVAGAGADTIGVMNLRGQIVQVISLRQRLGLGSCTGGAECRVVVLEEDGVVLGLLVDGVAEVFAANADAINESGLVHGALPADWFRGLLRRGGDLVVALDASRLLVH